MFGIGPWELILIMVVALIVFGPGKLPEIGKSLGKTIMEFKNAASKVQQEAMEAIKIEDQLVVKSQIKPEEKPVVGFELDPQEKSEDENGGKSNSL